MYFATPGSTGAIYLLIKVQSRGMTSLLKVDFCDADQPIRLVHSWISHERKCRVPIVPISLHIHVVCGLKTAPSVCIR